MTMDYVASLRECAQEEPVAGLLGMRLVDISAGYAKVSMKVRQEHLNFNGMVFGGVIMGIADQAFAYASNSVVHPSIASQFNIHFIDGPKVGDELLAECWVVKSGTRVGISEMSVTTQDGKLVAKATGTTIPVRRAGR